MGNLSPELSLAFGKYPKPQLISEEEAEEIRMVERKREFDMKVKLAGIPKRYAKASIRDCRDEVAKYAADIDGKKQSPWLILSGANGTGKTHQACAVMLHQIWRHPNLGARFASMGKILGKVNDTYGTRESGESALHEYTNCRLLIIDDFGKERPSSASQAARFFRVINERYDNMKPTIFTTNLSSEELVKALTVDGDVQSAVAIVDRMADASNVMVSFDGRSMRR